MAETFEAYRTRILSYLGDEEPIGVQQATPSHTRSASARCCARGVDPASCTKKWSIAEIVAHLADAESAMGWRLRNMLANPGVALTWWDQAVWAERLGYAQQDAGLSAGVFRALRESNLRLLESVPRARWVECYGVHEVRGRQTVEEFVRLEAAQRLAPSSGRSTASWVGVCSGPAAARVKAARQPEPDDNRSTTMQSGSRDGRTGWTLLFVPRGKASRTAHGNGTESHPRHKREVTLQAL